MTDKRKNQPDLVAIAKKAVKKHSGGEGHGLSLAAIKMMEANGGQIGRSELLSILKETVSSERIGKLSPRGIPLWIQQLDSYSSRYARIKKEGRRWLLADAKSDDLLPPPLDIPSDERELDEPDQAQLGDKISDYIKNMSDKNDGKDLEEISAALLRGMGYCHVEVRGGSGDGGVDVVAYKDKLGAIPPRVKVQAKHWTAGQAVRTDTVRSLEQNVHEGEIGVVITTSSFTKDARDHANNSNKHLLLIDLDRLVELWVEHYPHMSEKDRKWVPLKYALDT